MRIEVPSERSGHFNGLRLLFAVAVSFSHAYSGTGHEDPVQAWSGGQLVPSQLGVYGFFVISGFLVWRSLMRSAGPLDYLAKRSLRILPALVVVVVLSVAVLGPLATEFPLSSYAAAPDTWRYLLNPWVMLRGGVLFDLPGVFTMLHVTAVNVSLWTLPYEFLCYALLLLALPLRAHRIAVKLALAIAWATALAVSYAGLGGEIPHTSFAWSEIARILPCFLGGCLLSELRIEHQLARPLTFLTLAVATGIALSAGVFTHVKLLLLPPLVIGLAHVALPGRWPSLPVDLSYGLYLAAWPIQQVLSEVFQPQPLVLFLFTTIAAALYGSASWTLVERPALARKPAVVAWLQRKRAGRP